MKHHPLLASLARTPWAILESYVPQVTMVLSRLFAGGELSADEWAAVRSRRCERDARHEVQAREADDFQRIHGSAGSSGDVALIPIYGVITQRGGMDADTSEPLASAARIGRAVQLAAADPSVSAIVLDVDSPGGSVYGVAELADIIYAARQVKSVRAVANSVMASAAYWTASQAGEVYAAPGAEVGSIGCYAIHFDVSDALRQAGVSPTVISAGRYKAEGVLGPLDPDARAHVQSSVNEYHDQFVRAVARGRGTTQKAVREGMGQGRVLLPAAAKAENMIDGIATLGEVVAKAAQASQGRSRASAATAAEWDRRIDALQAAVAPFGLRIRLKQGETESEDDRKRRRLAQMRRDVEILELGLIP